MAEVEDVAGVALHLGEETGHFLFDGSGGAEEDGGVEVALEGKGSGVFLADGGEISVPVKADGGRVECSKVGCVVRGAAAKEDGGPGVDGVENFLKVGGAKGGEVVRGELSSPGVKKLNSVDTRSNLDFEGSDHMVCDGIEKGVEGFWF